MSVIENGVLKQTSVTQVDLFEGCPNAWWLEYKQYLKQDMGAAAIAGEAGHALLAGHFRGEPLPTRAKMLKAVSAAIQKGELPKPGPDLLVELRGDGQEKYSKFTCSCKHPNSTHVEGKGKCTEPGCDCEKQSPMWLPLLRDKTLWIAGVPFELFIDLTYRRGRHPVVLDHKFKAKDRMHTAKQGHELIDTMQMPVYALAMMRTWPDAKRFQLAHHYVCRTGEESFIRGAVVSTDQIREREAQIGAVVTQMKRVAGAETQEDVPFNRRWCEVGPIGLGCPHLSVCRAYKENKVQLSAAEEEEFAKLDQLTLDDAPPAQTKASPVEDDEDEEAKLKAEYEAKLAKSKEEKRLKAEAEAKAKAAAEAEAKKKAAQQSVLPPDGATSKPELASEKPAEKKGKGASTPAGGVSITLHFPTAAEAAAALAKLK